MNAALGRDVYFSFFMFTADLRPLDTQYTRVLIDHLETLTDMGYDGFDVHIAAQPTTVDHNSRSTATSVSRRSSTRRGWGR